MPGWIIDPEVVTDFLEENKGQKYLAQKLCKSFGIKEKTANSYVQRFKQGTLERAERRVNRKELRLSEHSINEGRVCPCCGVWFEQPNNKPVLCAHCYSQKKYRFRFKNYELTSTKELSL